MRTIPAATSQSGSAAWGQYRAWNAAIETYFFSGRFAGRPVYIDLNPETLSAIGEAVDVEIADARKALVDAVKATLALTLAPNPFQAHLYIANAWRRKGTGESPPFLALLAFFSLVAEAMTADEQFVANNYYDRLCSMLGVEKEDVKDRIKEGYREAALPLWDALNSWLNDWSGERGLPTARSLDVRKYVSTAISQALIRDHDRLQLRRLFGDYKLAAGQQLQPLEMKQLLAHWISRGHQNSSLFRLWRKGDEIQSRIAQLACAELEAWDGKGEAQGRGGQVPLTLMAELRTHPLPSIELYLVANSASRLQGKYKLASSSDDAARRAIEVSRGVVELQSMPRENQFSLEPWSSIRVGDAMLARLELEPTENWRPRLTRVGQPLCVLSYRELEGQFREINQAQMMDTTLVLAHETLRDTVALHLAQCARPGYREMSARSLSGLPSKWVAFLDVEIARSVASDGLEALTPASERQLLVAKGMSLDRGTWHSGDPPEVRVSAEGGERFEVRLNQRFSLSRSVQPMVLGSFEGASALPLKGSGLPDGDYEISIQSVRGSKRAAETSFRLRSSSNPRPLAVIGAGRVAHILKAESPLGVLSASLYREDDASNSDPSPPTIEGALVRNGELHESPVSAGALPSLSVAAGEEEAAPTHGAVLETTATVAESCVLRGFHYWICDTVMPGAPKDQLVRQRCSGCGLENWSRARDRRRRPASRQAPAPRQTLPAQSPRSAPQIAVVDRREGADLDLLLDGACYLRGGTTAQFSLMAATVDSQPWFTGEILRQLSALAHLDISLDPSSLRPVGWRVSPTVLVRIEPSRAVLSGWRNPELVASLRECVEPRAGRLQIAKATSGVPVITVEGLDDGSLQRACNELSAMIEQPIECVSDLSARILSCLMPLRAVADHLPRISVPTEELESFNFENSRWEHASQISAPGAYRARWRGVSYFCVSRDGLASKEGRLADARTVKHLGAAELGVSLVGYADTERSLIVPLGCELPGLLDRAATMCSGQPPERRGGFLYYHDVPAEIARWIWRHLGSRT